jgi:hypothetical protein
LRKAGAEESGLGVLWGEAEELVGGADDETAVGDGWGGVAGIAEFGGTEEFEGVGVGADDGDFAGAADAEDAVA